MIVVVDRRDLVTAAYVAQFAHEGVAATGFCPDEFNAWFDTADKRDTAAISAFLIDASAVVTGDESDLDDASTEPSRLATEGADSKPILAMLEQPALERTLALFHAGVVDVVRKPVHAREILARLACITRRSKPKPVEASSTRVQVFADGRDPEVDGEPFPLPRREQRILEYLVSIEERRASKAQIYNAIYGIFNSDIEECVIESHISKLRKKLRTRLGYDPIDSKRFLGYRMTLDAPAMETGEVPEKDRLEDLAIDTLS